jgi:glucose/arabinose dehydrogenase
MSIKKKYLLPSLAAIFFIGIILAYFGVFDYQSVPAGETIAVAETDEQSEAPEAPPSEVQRFQAVRVIQGLEVPWGAVFTSTERLLITERAGRVRVAVNGSLESELIHVFSQVKTGSEEGLMGITLDPHYDDNKLVYFAYAYGESELKVKIVRLTDTGTALENEQVVIDNIPAAKYHAGTRIAFGPDQKLYITTGDATNKKTPQDLKSLGGKILRVNGDGSIPEDNPFEGSPVYTYGHRNSQGITWDTTTGEMYATEHGPSLFDGPAGGDEINHIIPGGNYGWPLVSHKEKLDEAEEPMLLFTPAVAPSGITFVKGDRFSSLTHTLLFAGLKGEGLYRVVLKATDPGKVKEYQKLSGIAVGRVRDVFEGPDGNIYFLSSNKDGRGNPTAGDDSVYRLELAE